MVFHPIAPHITEEIWELMGKEGYISLASWPKYDPSLLNIDNEFKWNLLNNILDDINSIRLAANINTIKSVKIIIADKWKFEFYSIFMELIEKTKNQGEIMKELMKKENLKVNSKFISQITSKILKNIGKFPRHNLSQSDELQFFKQIELIIQKKYNCEVKILVEHQSESKKAIQALPGRPAIVIT